MMPSPKLVPLCCSMFSKRRWLTIPVSPHLCLSGQSPGCGPQLHAVHEAAPSPAHQAAIRETPPSAASLPLWRM